MSQDHWTETLRLENGIVRFQVTGSYPCLGAWKRFRYEKQWPMSDFVMSLVGLKVRMDHARWECKRGVADLMQSSQVHWAAGWKSEARQG